MLLWESQSCRGPFWSTVRCARAAFQSPSRLQHSSALDLVANALWSKCHLKSIQPRKSTRCNSNEFFLEGWEFLLKGIGAVWLPALCTRGASQVLSARHLSEFLQKWHRAQIETFPPHPLTFTVKVFFWLTCGAFACKAEVLGRDEKRAIFTLSQTGLSVFILASGATQASALLFYSLLLLLSDQKTNLNSGNPRKMG